MTAEELKNEIGGLIWKTATNLVHGGKVSPVQFMDYMLGALFYLTANFSYNHRAGGCMAARSIFFYYYCPLKHSKSSPTR